MLVFEVTFSTSHMCMKDCMKDEELVVKVNWHHHTNHLLLNYRRAVHFLYRVALMNISRVVAICERELHLESCEVWKERLTEVIRFLGRQKYSLRSVNTAWISDLILRLDYPGQHTDALSVFSWAERASGHKFHEIQLNKNIPQHRVRDTDIPKNTFQ